MHPTTKPVGTEEQTLTMNRSTPSSAAALVEMNGISKRFGDTQALDEVSLSLLPGEIHALLGENGAGKSTLMGVLAGLVAPDRGTIQVQGNALPSGSPKASVRHGIGLVQQHMALVEQITGTDNFLLSNPDGRFLLGRKAAAGRLHELSLRYGLDVDHQALVSNLSIGERQRLEILIALSLNAKVLILDEPTSALNELEAEALAGILRKVAADGNAVVYISHKLSEIMSLADKVTVMRRGQVVSRFGREEMSEARLVRDMIGELPPRSDPAPVSLGEPVFAAINASASNGDARQAIRDITLTVHRHEVVGIAGVAGSGQDVLARLLAGQVTPAAGTLPTRPNGVGFVPEDRHHDAIAPELTIVDNAIVHVHRHRDMLRRGWLDTTRTTEYASAMLTRANVYPPMPKLPIRTLSGGNQQKLVLARELALEPDLLVIHNPYRGLDVRAAAEVRQRVLDERQRGAGIVMISSDLDDLVDLADRILVMYAGRFVGSLTPEQATPEALGRMMAGAQQQ